MFNLLRLLGIVRHTPRSILAERTREMYKATHELDLLEIHLEQVRAERMALNQRIARLRKNIEGSINE